MLLRGNVSYTQRARSHARDSPIGQAKAPHPSPLSHTAHKRNNPHGGVIHGNGSAASGHHNATNPHTLAQNLTWAQTIMGGLGVTSKAVSTIAKSDRNPVGRFVSASKRLPGEKKVKAMVKFGKNAGEMAVKVGKKVAIKGGRIAQGGKEKIQKVGMGALTAGAAMYGAMSLGVD